MSHIYIASDHHGLDTRIAVADHLMSFGYTVYDMGTGSHEMVDYPKIVVPLARAVAEDPKHRRGILLCGTGIGVCMVANRFPHVLAAGVWNQDMAARAVIEDNVNVLCLAADYLDADACIDLISIWLKNAFSGEERYVRRLSEIAEIDKNR